MNTKEIESFKTRPSTDAHENNIKKRNHFINVLYHYFALDVKKNPRIEVYRYTRHTTSIFIYFISQLLELFERTGLKIKY